MIPEPGSNEGAAIEFVAGDIVEQIDLREIDDQPIGILKLIGLEIHFAVTDDPDGMVIGRLDTRDGPERPADARLRAEPGAIESRDDGSYSVDGGARIDYLEETLGLQVPEEGFPTLGGRVFEQLQRRPRAGDEVQLGNFRAEVLEVDGMRICRVLLTRLDGEAAEEIEPREAENGGRGDEGQGD